MRDQCWMFREVASRGGGGNILSSGEIVVRRKAALGDVLSATVIAQRLADMDFQVAFQTHPHCAALLKYVPCIKSVTAPEGHAHIDLDGAYESHPFRRARHFHQIWFEVATRSAKFISLDLGTPANARPRLYLRAQQREVAKALYCDWPRPVVLICPKSQYYNTRSVPDRIWEAAAGLIDGTVGWLGLDPAPGNTRDLKVRTVDSLIHAISAADLIITTDTGPMHISAALNVKTLVLGQSSDPVLHLTDQQDWQAIYPKLDCLNCQENKCPKNYYMPPCQEFNPNTIAAKANQMLRKTRVSAVVPIYKPDKAMLDRCLEALRPQVDEIVLTMESGGVCPGYKDLLVTKPEAGIGFGRNVNFGVRHTSGDLVLILNDDVYLEPDAVAKMKAVMGPSVGIVGQFLKYPDGRIYHAGKPRAPGGGIGFPHVDLGKYLPSITQPCEMENTNGASILVRREAFYDIGGYDERFLFYAEDDDLCMRMRKHGWKVWYQPDARGIHEEHRETSKLPDRDKIMHQSNRLFGQLWGRYFYHNRDNRGLGNFNYCR